MILFVGKTIFAALIISFVSWLSNKRTDLAGFLTALPLTTLLALAFSHAEWGDAEKSVEFPKSVFLAVPVSLLFFLPFFFAKKFNLGFWLSYSLGIVLLTIGYFAHKHINKLI